MATDLNSLFRLSGPSPADIESFHNDGYIAFPNVFTDHARESLIKEIEGLDQVREYVQQLESHRGEPKSYFIRPWNERGPYSDQLIDDPFIASVLKPPLATPITTAIPRSTSRRAASGRFVSTRTITTGSMRIPSTMLNATNTTCRFSTT